MDLVSLWNQRRLERGHGASALVADLFRATRNVLDRPGWREPQKGKEALNLALWTALVMAWDPRLLTVESGHRPTVDLFAVRLDALGRDFLARDACKEEADSLSDRWGDLTESLARATHAPSDALTTARSRLLAALNRFLGTMVQRGQPLWLERLSQRVRETVRESERLMMVMELADDD